MIISNKAEYLIISAESNYSGTNDQLLRTQWPITSQPMTNEVLAAQE